MKKVFCFFTCLALSVAARAQSAEEILEKMDEVFGQYENSGIAMTVQTKIPILGSVTMKDLSFNVTEDQVTFDPKKYASAKVVDKRNIVR